MIIFDDVACNKQSSIRDYFSMGRHKLMDCFYLYQTYKRIPIHLITDNANVLVLFKQDVMNFKYVYNDHVNTNMKFHDFKRMCSLCWKDEYEFLVITLSIDKGSDIRNGGRYRKGFIEYKHKVNQI